jgi:hypothetical protein
MATLRSPRCLSLLARTQLACLRRAAFLPAGPPPPQPQRPQEPLREGAAGTGDAEAGAAERASDATRPSVSGGRPADLSICPHVVCRGVWRGALALADRSPI